MVSGDPGVDNTAALSHAVKVESVASPVGARWYVGRYFGKQRQKKLPAGVSGAGRWWGRSRGLVLDLVEEVVTCRAKAQADDRVEVWVTRQLRRYLTRRFGRKFRGGFFVDWGGGLCEALARMTRECRQWFTDCCDRERARVQAVLDQGGWELVPVEGNQKREGWGGAHGTESGVGVAGVGLDRESAAHARIRWAQCYRRLRTGRRRRSVRVDDWRIGEGAGCPSSGTRTGLGERGRDRTGEPEPGFDLGEAPDGSASHAA